MSPILQFLKPPESPDEDRVAAWRCHALLCSPRAALLSTRCSALHALLCSPRAALLSTRWSALLTPFSFARCPPSWLVVAGGESEWPLREEGAALECN
eukprot:gene16624-biopygen10170